MYFLSNCQYRASNIVWNFNLESQKKMCLYCEDGLVHINLMGDFGVSNNFIGSFYQLKVKHFALI